MNCPKCSVTMERLEFNSGQMPIVIYYICERCSIAVEKQFDILPRGKK